MKALAILFFFLLLPTLGARPLAAAGLQDFQQLRAQAAGWLQREAAQRYPDASVVATVGGIDPRLRLPACDDIRFFLPGNATLWGRGTLGARCAGGAEWTLYVSYENRLRGPGVAATRPLPARTPLGADDVVATEVEYAQSPDLYPRELPPGAFLSRAVAAGQAIQVDWLMLPNVVRAGQKVRVRVTGDGFVISQEGTAQNAAAPGDVVRVKVTSGRIVQGIAGGDGVVEVR